MKTLWGWIEVMVTSHCKLNATDDSFQMAVVSGKFYFIYILPHISLINVPALTAITHCDHRAVFIRYISSLRPRYHEVGNTLTQNNAKYFGKQTEEHAPGKLRPSTNHNGRKHARVKTRSLQPKLRVYTIAWCTDRRSMDMIQEC